MLNFNNLNLKKLISTCYATSPIKGQQLSLFDVEGGEEQQKSKTYKAVVTKVYDVTGDGGVDMLDVAELFKMHENELTELKGDGDFRSEECLELLNDADIVVTNPPFSLFREYVAGSFSVDEKYFSNLPKDKKEQILNYELIVYVCEGTDSEKLDWFRIINIAGEKLTDQELRNAVYAGSWVYDAKTYFSKTKCPASSIAKDYLKGSSIRQDFLETAISWIASAKGETVEGYMAKHQNDPTAEALWKYFFSVIDWVKKVFPKTRREMKGLPWGLFYNKNHNRTDLDPVALEKRVSDLMADEDVQRKAGVYEYLLTGNEKPLSIRAFNQRTKREMYEKQDHKCAICGKEYKFEDMHADHIKPWSKGGHTTPDNCQMLCRDCNLKKGAQK